MTLPRHILLGLALLGLSMGRAAGAEPELPPAQGPAGNEPMKHFPAAAEPMAAPPGCVSGLCCQDLGECCDTCPGGLIGGVGLYVLQPYFNNNMAFGLQGTAGRSGTTPASPPGFRVDNRIEISHHMQAAPEVWLGYIGEDGLGARARWWYFRQGTDQSVAGTAPGVNGLQVFTAAPLGLSFLSVPSASSSGAPAVVVTSKLELQVGDVEAVYDMKACGWDLLLVGGVRLAWIDQTYNAYVPRGGNNTLLSSSTFGGAGPTLALEARRPLGIFGLGLYARGRGALVFGSAHQIATVPDQNVAANDHRDVGMPISEAEVGLEYGRALGRSRLFGQVALVGQEWFGAGSASRSSVNVVPGGGFVGAAYSGDSDISLLGLSIRLGVNY